MPSGPKKKRPGGGLSARLRKIRLLISDVDGVLTAGGVTLSKAGDESKTFHVRDGAGVFHLRHNGVVVALVTGRKSSLTDYRAEELGIEDVFQGNVDKTGAYNRLKKKYGLADEAIAAVGDDLPDLALFARAGVAFAVADAVEEVRAAADAVTGKPGGAGAVREIAEMILKAKGKWSKTVERYAGK